MKLTVDAYAWLELIQGSPAGGRVRDQLNQADECITPSIVLAEIASKLVRLNLPNRAIKEQLRAIREASQVVVIDVDLAIAGAHAREELQRYARENRVPLPGLADGLILATARGCASQLLTGDPHFRQCPETIWLD